MCQYSAEDGSATDWHLQHLMQFAMARAGMVVVEATAVERVGRITHKCLGIYSDANEAALARVLKAAKAVAAPGTCFAIQLAHAGRKASVQPPFEGAQPLKSGEIPGSRWHPRRSPSAPTGIHRRRSMPQVSKRTLAGFLAGGRTIRPRRLRCH